MTDVKPCFATDTALNKLYVDGDISADDRELIGQAVPAGERDRVVNDAQIAAQRCKATFGALRAINLTNGLNEPTPANVRSALTMSGSRRADAIVDNHTSMAGIHVDTAAIARDLTQLIGVPSLNTALRHIFFTDGMRFETLLPFRQKAVADAFTDSLSEAQLRTVDDASLDTLAERASPAQTARLRQELSRRSSAASLRQSMDLPQVDELTLNSLAALGTVKLGYLISHAAPRDQIRAEAALIEATER
jgi:hypothetical protein